MIYKAAWFDGDRWILCWSKYDAKDRYCGQDIMIIRNLTLIKTVHLPRIFNKIFRHWKQLTALGFDVTG